MMSQNEDQQKVDGVKEKCEGSGWPFRLAHDLS